MLITKNGILQNVNSIAKSSSTHDIIYINRNWKEVMAETKKSGRLFLTKTLSISVQTWKKEKYQPLQKSGI